MPKTLRWWERTWFLGLRRCGFLSLDTGRFAFGGWHFKAGFDFADDPAGTNWWHLAIHTPRLDFDLTLVIPRLTEDGVLS